MIFRISVGYEKKVLKMSQLSCQLLTQEGYCFPQFPLNAMRCSKASSSVTAVPFFQISHQQLDVLIAHKAVEERI